MRLSLPALLALVSCGGGPGEPLRPDGAPPDAMVRPPDAGPPDAAIPDAGPPDAQGVNCANVPNTGPFVPTLMPGFVASEDLAFDMAGHVIESDTSNIYKTTKQGQRTTFVPNFPFRAGMRMTPAGDLIVNDDFSGSLVRVDPQGVRYTILSGLSYPNGMEIDPDGWVYVAEQNADRVLRVHPITGEYTVLVDGEIAAPNGISFDPLYTSLYVGGFSGAGIIYQLKVNADGTPGQLTEFATNVGTGALDGIGVDECGFIYIADFGASEILRINPFTRDYDVVIDGNGSYMPNMDWGSGLGGWDSNLLYIVAVGQGIYEVDVGVRSKPRVWPE